VDQIEKRSNVRESGVRAFTMRDIDERGLRAVMEEAIRAGFRRHGRFPPFARYGFRRPQRRARRRHARARRRHLPGSAFGNGNDLRFGKMVSMEVVEVNPVIDESNRTADLAVELIMSGMGKRIL
jgi:arginase